MRQILYMTALLFVFIVILKKFPLSGTPSQTAVITTMITTTILGEMLPGKGPEIAKSPEDNRSRKFIRTKKTKYARTHYAKTFGRARFG